MGARWCFLIVVGGAITAGAAESVEMSVDALFREMVLADSSSDCLAVGKRLSRMSDAGLERIRAGTFHARRQVRESCYCLLVVYFLEDSQSGDPVVKAFHDAHLRDELASGLELDKRAVVRSCYWGMGSDRYWTRFVANACMKTLVGKDLADFGHDPSDGAILISLDEWSFPQPSVRHAQMRAARYNAISQYCQWLSDEKPEVYRLLDPNAEVDFVIEPINFGDGAPREVVDAWRRICEADRAFEGGDPFAAKELLEEALIHWRDLEAAFAERREIENATHLRTQLSEAAKLYQEVLVQLDEEMPDDSPLRKVFQVGDADSVKGAAGVAPSQAGASEAEHGGANP